MMRDQDTIMENLHQQSDAIDQIMTSFGMVGHVTGGERNGYTTNYHWELTTLDLPRLGDASPDDLSRELVQRFGHGVSWRSVGAGIIITAPLSPDATIAAMRLMGTTAPAVVVG